MPLRALPRPTASARRCVLQVPGLLALAAALVMLMTVPPARGEVSAGAGLGAAQVRVSAGDYSGAAEMLKEILLSTPGDAAAHYLSGRCYYELHDYDHAVEEAVRSVELAPENSLYHQWLGRAYGGKADREKSFFLARKVKKELEKAVALDPSNVGARRDLQRFYTDAPWIVGGSREKALAMVDAIASIDPVEGRLARADYDLHALGDSAAADKEYRAVLATGVRRAGPYFEAADFFAGRKDASSLEQALKAAVKASPSDPRLSYYRGVAGVVAGGGPDDAERELRAYLAAPERSDWPSHADAREWLGRLFEGTGRLSDAAAEYRKALVTEPSRRETLTRLRNIEKSLKR